MIIPFNHFVHTVVVDDVINNFEDFTLRTVY
jgi:hypothetical protein